MAVTNPDLESYLNALGDCTIFVGDPFVAGGLEELGAKQGDCSIAWNYQYNELKFEEATGDIPHDVKVRNPSPVITLPMIIGNVGLWEKLQPTALAGGVPGGGHSSPQPANTKTMVMVPAPQLLAAGEGGYAFGGGPPKVWTPSAPVNWVWFWKVYVQFPDFAFRETEGGKTIGSAIIKSMYRVGNPEGHKIFTIGDPGAAGIDITI